MTTPFEILKNKYGSTVNQPVSDDERRKAEELQRLGVLLNQLYSGASMAANTKTPNVDYGEYGALAASKNLEKQKAFDNELSMNQSSYNKDRNALMDNLDYDLKVQKQAEGNKKLSQDLELGELKKKLLDKELKKVDTPKISNPLSSSSSTSYDPIAERARVTKLNQQKAFAQKTGNQALLESIDAELNTYSKAQRLRQVADSLKAKVGTDPQAQAKLRIVEQELANLPQLNVDQIKKYDAIEKDLYITPEPKQPAIEKQRYDDLRASGLRNLSDYNKVAKIGENDQEGDFDPTALSGYVSGSSMFPQFLKSSDRQQIEASGVRAVEGLLRARSGAAVPESEVTRYSQAWLPQPGDSPETAQAKLDALKADLSGGNSLPDPFQNGWLTQQESVKSNIPGGAQSSTEEKIINGKTYINVPGKGWKVK